VNRKLRRHSTVRPRFPISVQYTLLVYMGVVYQGLGGAKPPHGENVMSIKNHEEY
jgi:hypothetical protein